MKKQISVSLIAVVVLTAVLAAGCTSQTASPTPSTNAAQSTGTASTALMASYMQSLGYNVTSPFKKLDLPITFSFGERDQYTSTAGNKTVSAIVLKSSTETSDAYNSLVSGQKNRNYTVAATDNTSTTLDNGYGGHLIYIKDTQDNLLFQIVS